MNNAHTIVLPELLDVSAFEAVRELLTNLPKKKQPIALDASRVERLTTPCLQLLMAFLKAAPKGAARSVAQPSEAMRVSWVLLGCADEFPLTERNG